MSMEHRHHLSPAEVQKASIEGSVDAPGGGRGPAKGRSAARNVPCRDGRSGCPVLEIPRDDSHIRTTFAERGCIGRTEYDADIVWLGQDKIFGWDLFACKLVSAVPTYEGLLLDRLGASRADLRHGLCARLRRGERLQQFVDCLTTGNAPHVLPSTLDVEDGCIEVGTGKNRDAEPDWIQPVPNLAVE